MPVISHERDPEGRVCAKCKSPVDRDLLNGKPTGGYRHAPLTTRCDWVTDTLDVELTDLPDEVIQGTRIVWYARFDGMRRMGPYLTELEAWKSLKGLDGDPVKGSIVWLEEEPWPPVSE